MDGLKWWGSELQNKQHQNLGNQVLWFGLATHLLRMSLAKSMEARF